MHAHLAQHALGQGAVHRHHRARLAGLDQPHGLGGTHQKMLFVQTQAAMAIGMHQAATRQGAGHFSDKDLLLFGSDGHGIRLLVDEMKRE